MSNTNRGICIETHKWHDGPNEIDLNIRQSSKPDRRCQYFNHVKQQTTCLTELVFTMRALTLQQITNVTLLYIIHQFYYKKIT